MGKRVKIVCHTCLGEGHIEEVEFETRQITEVICPECGGTGWVYAEKWEGKYDGRQT